jgi:hypothetical protein
MDDKRARREVCERIKQDYRDRFTRADISGFNAFGNATGLGVEVLFGSPVGPVWGTWVRLGRRRFPFGPVEPIRPLAEARGAATG